MASLYRRANRIWINFRDEQGQWKNRSTGWRWNNAVETRLAKKLCDQQTLKERTTAKTTKGGSWDWVPIWIESSWNSLTRERYQRCWQQLAEYLKEAPVAGPANLSREHCLSYLAWREKRGGGRNTATLELRFLGQVMDEAIQRGYAEKNPSRGLRIKRDAAKEKFVWTDEELATVDTALAKDPYGWMRATFLLGRFQASRLRQANVPLSAIDLDRGVIDWPASVMKARRGFSQPIVAPLLPLLRDIVKHREENGHKELANVPQLASLEWRQFLDSLGLRHLSHHGLRATLITRAAKAGIPESIAQRFSGHSSNAVHRIYMKFSTDDMAEALRRL